MSKTPLTLFTILSPSINNVSFAFAVVSFLLIESIVLGLNLELIFVSLMLVLPPQLSFSLALVGLFIRLLVMFYFALS